MKLTHTVAVVLAGALVAGGCGASEDSATDVAPAKKERSVLAAAIERSDKSDEPFRMAVEMDLDTGESKVHMTGTVDSSADAQRSHGRLEYDDGSGSSPTEVIGIDGVSYMRGGPIERLLPKGKRWLLADPEGVTDRQMTPKQFIGLLRDTPGVKETGRERVRGRDAVRLSGPIDFRKASKRIENDTIKRLAEQQPEMLDRIEGLADVWVDAADSRILRMRMVMKVDGKPTLTSTGEIVEEGIDLDVRAPDEDEVATQEEIARTRSSS